MLMPATAPARIVIKTGNGTGNAGLYYRASTWPSTSTYDQRSINTGNSETITVNAPGANAYRYMAVVGQHSGLTLIADIQ